MKALTQEQVKDILRKHKIWLEDPTNKEAEQANLREADLQGVNLQWANLQGVNLQGANLQGVNLQWANLREADLQEANLQAVNLQWANLQEANLRWANLRWANLQGANLQGADLQWANLQWANLQGADLQWANLQEADLRWADYTSMQCPEEGAFIAFKKCRDGKIVKLLIPEDAKRSSATSRKCRASKAIVLEITSLDGKTQYKKAVSTHDEDFIYRKGETVEAKDFDNDRWNECAPGIHFFITRQEAIDY